MHKSHLALCLLMLFLLLPLTPFINDAVAAPDWLAGGWDQRVAITIQSSDIDEPLTDYPVMLHLSNDSSGINSEDVSFIFDELGANSKKIAFTSSDEVTQLYGEIDYWDATLEIAYIWVLVPSGSNVSDTIIYMYYDVDADDNDAYVGATPDNAASNAVWDTSGDFAAVWHLKDDSVSAVLDSTSNENTGTKIGANEPIEASGKIAESQLFDGTNDEINMGEDGSLDLGTITIMFWLYPNGYANIDSILAKRESGDTSSWMIDHWGSGNLVFNIWIGSAEAELQSGAGSFPDAVWSQAVCTYDGAKTRIYVNGSFDNFASYAGTIDSSPTTPVWLGTNGYTSQWDGLLDEIWILDGNSTDAWITSTYENQRDHFVDWGTVVLKPITTVFLTTTGSGFITTQITSTDSVYHTDDDSSTTGTTLAGTTATVSSFYSTTDLDTIISVVITVSVDASVTVSEQVFVGLGDPAPGASIAGFVFWIFISIPMLAAVGYAIYRRRR